MFKYRWPCYLGLIVIIAVVVGWWWFCGARTTVLLVRHADRNGALDDLSETGDIRAQELVHVAGKAGIAAIIRSDAIRAEQTAQPLAAALGITPIALSGNDIQVFADEIHNNHRGQTVLVVGHSNTVAPIIAALGGPSLSDIDDAEFDNLFVLNLCRCSRRAARLTNLQYGAVSP